MPMKEKWLHGSTADNPSGIRSPHTWQGSPQSSGSSSQKQITRPPHIATNDMQTVMAIAIQPFNMVPLFMTMPRIIS